MLILKAKCEECGKGLPPESNEAWICSFECTFCEECARDKHKGAGKGAGMGSEMTKEEELSGFAKRHARLLNSLVRQNPALLRTQGGLAVLVRSPPCRVFLEFDNKRAYFRAQLRSQRGRHPPAETIHLQIRRGTAHDGQV